MWALELFVGFIAGFAVATLFLNRIADKALNGEREALQNYADLLEGYVEFARKVERAKDAERRRLIDAAKVKEDNGG